MTSCLGYNGLLALELVLVWLSFSPIFPLLTAPRREPSEEPPSPVPRLLCAVAATAAVSAAAASIKRARMRTATSEQNGRQHEHAFARSLLRGAFSLLSGALVIHVVAVVLGAPVLRAHERGTMVTTTGCVLGAWLGAIPLCLDWEQPWQDWPLPMCAGGLLGFSLGCLLLLGLGLAEYVRRHVSSWRPDKRA